MKRVLLNGDWYEPLSAASVLEKDFENSILRYSKDLFPGYICVPFNKTVNSEYGASQADLALIDYQYRDWIVVEVELEHHSLSGHVEPQLRRLSSGKYDEQHALALCAANSSLEVSRVTSMVKSNYPGFLVLSTSYDPRWVTELSNMGVRLAAIKIFMSRTGQRVVAVEGELPRSQEEKIASRIMFEPIMRGMKVESPGILPDSATVDLVYQSYVTTWRIVKAQKATHIFPNGVLDLDSRKKYAIFNDDRLGLVLKED